MKTASLSLNKPELIDFIVLGERNGCMVTQGSSIPVLGLPALEQHSCAQEWTTSHSGGWFKGLVRGWNQTISAKDQRNLTEYPLYVRSLGSLWNPREGTAPVTSWQAWWIRTWHLIKLDLKETKDHFILYTSKIAELLTTPIIYIPIFFSLEYCQELYFLHPFKERKQNSTVSCFLIFCVPFFYILSPSKSAENNSFFLKSFLIIMSKAVYLLDSISRFYFDCTAEYIVE